MIKIKRINGISLIKVGRDNKGRAPSVADLDKWRKVFEAAQGNPDYVFVSDHKISIK